MRRFTTRSQLTRIILIAGIVASAALMYRSNILAVKDDNFLPNDGIDIVSQPVVVSDPQTSQSRLHTNGPDERDIEICRQRELIKKLQATIIDLTEENQRLRALSDAVAEREAIEREEQVFVKETLDDLAELRELDNFAHAANQKKMYELLSAIMSPKKAAELTKLYFLLCMYEGRYNLPTRQAWQWKRDESTPPEIDEMLESWDNKLRQTGNVGQFVASLVAEKAGIEELQRLRAESIPPFDEASTPDYANKRNQFDHEHPLYGWRRFLLSH